MDGKLDAPTTVPQGKHTGIHRVEVCVGEGNEISVCGRREDILPVAGNEHLVSRISLTRNMKHKISIQ